MPDEIRFVNTSEKLTEGVKSYTDEGKKKSRLIKLTSKSHNAFKRAVNKRLVNSFSSLKETKEVLKEEYNNVYSELEKGLSESIKEKKADIDPLMDKFVYLTELGVKLVDTDRKLQSLNKRLYINNKKTFNLKGETFKKIVANISVLKKSVVDKFSDKKIVTNAYENSVEEIDKLMSLGQYYTAEQTLKKMGDYSSMSLGASTSPIREDIFSNTNGASTEEDLTEKNENNDVISTNDEFDSGEKVKIASIEEIDSSFLEQRKQTPEEPKEVEIPIELPEKEKATENSNSVSKFGIDFTKLIKNAGEELPKDNLVADNTDVVTEENKPTVSEIKPEEDTTALTSEVEEINKEKTEEIIANTNGSINFSELAEELGIDFSIASNVETKPEDNVEEELPKIEETNINLSEIIIDNLPIPNEEIVKIEEEVASETVNVAPVVEETKSKEIDGQIGFDSVVVENNIVGGDQSLIPETEGIEFRNLFRSLDEFNAEIAREKESYLNEIDIQAQNAISEIEVQAQNVMSDEVIVSQPIVASSEETYVPENPMLDGEEVKLDHELLKKMYDIISYKNEKISELEERIAVLEGYTLNESETIGRRR